MRLTSLSAALAGLALGCATSSHHAGSHHGDAPQAGDAQGGTPAATATLEPRSGSSMGGQGTFTRDGNRVVLVLDVTGVPAGTHAVHLHEKGDCSAPDASSAGPHWNPTEEPHGEWASTPHHLGDVGNLEVDEGGKGTLRLSTDRWEVGTGGAHDIVGKALVVHATRDDFVSQPAGAAGGRIGCGVVTATAAP